MALHGIEALAESTSHEIFFMLNPANRKLAQQLSAMPNVRVVESPLQSRSLQGIRNRIDRAGTRQLTELLKGFSPDLILCMQGDLEQSSQAMLAARRLGIECVSYLALPPQHGRHGGQAGKAS